MDKKVLFTTHDNINIFEGDRVFYLNKSNPWFIRIIPEWSSKDNTHYPETNISFSSRENIEEYISLNKPCLSINDILKEDEYCGEMLKMLTKRLKEKVKKTIKN